MNLKFESCRDKYPDANLVPAFYPVFSDGWVPKDVKNPHWAKLSKDIKRLVNIAGKTPAHQVEDYYRISLAFVYFMY